MASNFIYRQAQRLRYHMTSNQVEKRIAEINFYERRVTIQNDGYFIESLGLLLPLSGFSFIFDIRTFNLFLSNARRLFGTYTYENNQLIFEFASYRICIASASELFIIDEIFVQKCYNFKIPAAEQIGVVDIGMNAGLASLFFASQPNVAKVFSFEPFNPTFGKALANFKLNPSLASKIFACNFGLGKGNSSLSIPYNSENAGINSVLDEQLGANDVSSKETIELRDARSVIEGVLSENDALKFVLKIDTEGSEYPIFESLFSSSVSSRIVGFFIEWHSHGPEALETKLLAEGYNLASVNLNENTGLIYAFR